jgi:hypothetical protein
MKKVVEPLIHMRTPGFILSHDPSIPVAQVAGLVEAHDAVVAELRSDHITAEEGRTIHDLLVGGKILLPEASSKARELPGWLLKAWVGCVRGAATRAGRHIRFDFSIGPRVQERRTNGILVLILSSDYSGVIERSSYYNKYYVHREDFKNVEPRNREVHHTFGRLAVTFDSEGLVPSTPPGRYKPCTGQSA